ncbi:hypothetical protein ACJJTC_005334 [Scirpophaga incertulas]
MDRLLVIFLTSLCGVHSYAPAFDLELYEKVLDENKCQKQLNLLLNSSLNFDFIDASGRIPNGLLEGNLYSFGNYHQCLRIRQIVQDELIEGKYSGITLGLDQNPIVMPQMPGLSEWSETLETPDYSQMNDKRKTTIQDFMKLQEAFAILAGIDPVDPSDKDNFRRSSSKSSRETSSVSLFLGICIPKPCTSTQALDYYVNSVPFFNFTIQEEFYRLPNDKPFSPADYVAFVIFSVLLCITIGSTGYDLYCNFVMDCKPSKILGCFSIYTNTRRLLTFNASPGALECMDGIRAISMFWVIIGHSFSTTISYPIQNIIEALEWVPLFSSLWITAAPLSVDTFFLLTGILIVYTVIGKINRGVFVRNIPLFYINRLLRMFPLLAAMVLIQASIINHVSDGPYWINIAGSTENCRKNWWATLIHIQNYYDYSRMCLGQTWYLSVDTQLYILSPIILVCLFGSPLVAWLALSITVILSLVPVTVYSYTYNFPGSLVQPSRLGEIGEYMKKYYINTLTRSPPFFIGLAFGYLLHQYKGKKVVMRRPLVIGCWIISFLLLAFCFFSIYPVMQSTWDMQQFDNFLNAYVRSIWALSIGWVIFACVHGYGGLINWFLSLQVWKLPARLSYAMYLVHMAIMYVANSSWTTPQYFTEANTVYRFMADVSITIIASFVLCILIDAPFSTIQKQLLSGGGKTKPKENAEPGFEKSV